MSEQNKETVNQATNFKTGNVDTLIALMAEDVTWRLSEVEGAEIHERVR